MSKKEKPSWGRYMKSASLTTLQACNDYEVPASVAVYLKRMRQLWHVTRTAIIYRGIADAMQEPTAGQAGPLARFSIFHRGSPM